MRIDYIPLLALDIEDESDAKPRAGTEAAAKGENRGPPPYMVTETPPCKGCANFQTCKVELLACNDFVLFVEKGVRGGRNLQPCRVPTARNYKLMFPADERATA